jgi:hypothetical protein
MTYVLVRDDLDVLHVSSGLENLPENLFGDPGVQTANIQSSFVGLRGCAPDGAASAHGRVHSVEHVDLRDIHWERVVVLRDVEAERWLRGHALAVAILEALLLASLTRHTAHGRRHRELRLGVAVVISHCEGCFGGVDEEK